MPKAKADTEPPVPKPMCKLAPENENNDCDGNESIAINDSVIAEERSIPDGDYGIEVVLSEFFFKPIYALGVWQKPDDNDNRYVSIAFLLFTGKILHQVIQRMFLKVEIVLNIP